MIYLPFDLRGRNGKTSEHNLRADDRLSVRQCVKCHGMFANVRRVRGVFMGQTDVGKHNDTYCMRPCLAKFAD